MNQPACAGGFLPKPAGSCQIGSQASKKGYCLWTTSVVYCTQAIWRTAQEEREGSMEPIRKDLPEAVHSALRNWHTGLEPAPPWRDMLIVAQHPAASPAAGPDRAVQQILVSALNTLAEQARGEAANILRLRFLDCLTA